MPTHEVVNGLGLTYKGTIGISTATIPDVCKTPSPGGPVPIPYPNIARQSSLENGTTTVFAKGEMIAVKGSHYGSSNGDEAGTAGGIKSSVNMKATDWITYSFDVKLDGKNACRHTDKKFHNNQNAADLQGNVDPMAVAAFEAILDKCVNDAAKNNDPQRTPKEWEEFCADEARRQQRGLDIEAAARACVQARMAEQGHPDEVAYDQPYRGPPPTATGSPGEVLDGTVRPDLVLHAPGNMNAVRGVYDIKAPCPPGNMPEWGRRGVFNQGENFVRTFRRMPRIKAPGWRIASYANGAMAKAARLMRI